MTYLRDLQKDYQAYVEACLAAKSSVLPFNSWLQCKVMELERRLEKVERRMDECEGEK